MNRTGSGTAVDSEQDREAWADTVRIAVDRITGPVEGMHRAIADPWIRLASPKAADQAASFLAGIYNTVRLATSAGGTAVGAVLVSSSDGTERIPLRSSGVGAGMQAFANGVWGDELERRGSAACIELSLRDGAGRRISLDPGSLARSFPDAGRGRRVVVLVHGLGQTERNWQTRSRAAGTQPGLAEALDRQGFTPLQLRYNSGRHVPLNGADLANLLEYVCDGWPVPVEEVALVGFSLGGLVVRSALRYGYHAHHTWTRRVQHLITLAAPHLGSPIEKGANIGSWALGLAARTKPLSDFVETRSDAIRDLRHGAVGEGGTVADDPVPGGVKQHFLAGVIAGNPVGRLVGDFVVRPASGTGRGRKREVTASDVRVVRGTGHASLLHNQVVHRQVCDWLVGVDETGP